MKSETGISVGGLPAIGNTGSPFSSAASLTTGASYGASALATGSSPASGAPVISEWTRDGNPGDAVALTGSNLGSNLHVFVYGQTSNGSAVLAEATVVSAENGNAVITLPSGLPAGGVYTMWASNSAGFGAGVLVNAPELWWVGSDEVAPGAVTSLYGRNLVAPNGATPTVVLKMLDGSSAGQIIPVSVLKSSEYKVDVSLPSTLPDGHYAVYVNNNGGGTASWTQAQNVDLTVRAAVAHDWSGSDSQVINASSYGAVAGDGKDDSSALQNAINAARAIVASGGPIHEVTVQLGAGTYDLAQSVYLEDGVNLQGAGVGKTTLEPTAAFASTPHPMMLWADTSTASATATGSRVGDMSITTNGQANDTAIWGRSANHLTVNDVSITAMNGTPFDVNASDHFTLSNSTVTGPESFIGSAHQITIDSNNFYGADNADMIIGGFGATDVTLTNNTAQNLNANATASTWQTDTFQGRFYADQAHYGQSYNQYIGGNTTINSAAYIEYENEGASTNSGEQILFEGAGASTSLVLGNGLFKSATTTSLTLSKNPTIATNLATGALLEVASGTDAGATTEVTGYDPTTATFTFGQPLTTPLDATSTIVLSQAPNQIAVVGNTLDGRAQDVASSTVSASTGVQVYPGGARFAIANNSFSDLRQAVSLWSFPATKDDPQVGGDNSQVAANFFDIKNNTVTNSNVGVAFHQDPGGAADLAQPAAILYPHMTVGTTIRNNDLSGTTDASLLFDTRQPTSVDLAAANVASGNTLSTSGSVGGAGYDAGSPDLLVLNAVSATTPAALVQLARQLTFSSVARYFGTAAQPAFEATIGTDGTLAVDQTPAVAGTYNGQAALIATAGTGNDIGFTNPSNDSRLQVLQGGDGNDVLIGSAGSNVLVGGTGNDILVAGAGTTQMTGGAGADIFVLEPSTPSSGLAITDFSEKDGDKVVIDAKAPTGDPVAGGYLKLQAVTGGTAVMVSATGGGANFTTLATVSGTITAADVVFGLDALSAAATPTSSTTTSASSSPTSTTTPPTTSTSAPSSSSSSSTSPTTSTTTAPPTTGTSAPSSSSSSSSSSAPATTLTSGSSSTAPSTTTSTTTTTGSTGTTAAPAAADTLTVNVSEDAYKGNVQFSLNVDGKQVGGPQTVTTLHSSGKTQAFTFTGAFGTGAHTVGINFLNDAYGGSAAKDRNLYVKSIALDGQTTAENATQYSAGITPYKVSTPAGGAGVATNQPIAIPASATLILDPVTAATSAVTFGGAHATLQLTSASDFHGTIAGFGRADTLDLPSIAYGANSTTLQYAGNASSGTLSVSDGTHRAALALTGSYATSNFKLAADASGGTAISYVS